MKHNSSCIVWRTLFGALLVFEILSGLNLLSIKPTFTILGLILTLLAVWLGVEFTDALMANSKIRQHHSVAMAVLIPFTVYLDALGDLFHWYDSIPNYDSYLHFFNPVIGAIWIWHVIDALYPNVSLRFSQLTAASMMLAVGALYEIEEYLEDVFTGSHRFGDAWDTGNDLTMDFLGAVIGMVCLYIFFKIKKRKKTL